MTEYLELKERQQEEINRFPMFFAFNSEQFKEGMEKLGLEPGDTNLIYKLGNTGGYYRRSDAEELNNMFTRHERERQEAIKADTGEGYCFQMFKYELANHEYGYTGRLNDTLEALDLTREEVERSPQLSRGLRLALEEYN